MDYQNGKIYVLKSNQTTDIYIGSTAQPLPKRLYGHKRAFSVWLNRETKYMTSFEIIKHADCYIELLENFPCNSRHELETREGWHIRNIPCVNKRINKRTGQEYYHDNKEHLLECQKLKYIGNKTYFKEYQKQRYKEKKHEMLKYSKEYYEKHKEELTIKKKVQYTCECGGRYTHANKATHLKSKKHTSYIQTTSQHETQISSSNS